jgi:hypothetical protein
MSQVTDVTAAPAFPAWWIVAAAEKPLRHPERQSLLADRSRTME